MRKLILAYLEFTTMTTLLDNAVFNSKLLDQDQVIQMAESSELGLSSPLKINLAKQWPQGKVLLWLSIPQASLSNEHLLVTIPGHGVMRDVMNPTLMNKLGQGIMILLDSIYQLSPTQES